MHKVSRRRLASTVAKLLSEQPSRRDRTIKSLAAYLIEHKMQKHTDMLLMDIAEELMLMNGHLYAEVSSAHPLTTAARDDLVRYLKLMTMAGTVELNEQVDADLLTGLVVRSAGQELDTSARAKLNRLRNLNVNATREA